MQTQRILFFTFLILVVFWIVSCDDGKKNNDDLSLLIALAGQSSPNKEIVEPKVALNTAELKMQGQTYALGNTLCSKNGIAASAGANLLVDTGNSLIDFSKNSGVIVGPGGAGQIDFYVNLPADTYRVSTQCAATITKNDSKNYGLRFSNCPVVAQLNPGNSPVIGAIDFEIYCTKIN
ncbi:hypothetical protein [Leptospira stimsonii]|uniref:Lipoprotein n=1 Tax=Leptospira stimsonii TaxID=2202203 RepID=A0A396Z0R1_9LEPT|nr:hypothetical protein [Leptospira stimsonii]RHX87234.1 hypothetical protein DLM75_17160 [Leptospira stimsonii]